LRSDQSRDSPNQGDPPTLSHSFIVKVWLEEIKNGLPVWRGHVTHVPSKKREYFTILEDIPKLIGHYLQFEITEVDKSKRDQLYQLLKGLKLGLPRSLGNRNRKE
jgi:hypothetical protein